MQTASVRRAIVLGAVSILVLGLSAFPTPAHGYAGYLVNSTGGIQGTGNWMLGGVARLSWDVFQNADRSWTYAYEFSHARGETSHFILEASRSFTAADLFNASGDYGTLAVGEYAPGAGNPNMPDLLYGIKFDGAQGLTTCLRFDSWRAPIWGDFYAKNGNTGGVVNTAWNAGFTPLDTDPFAPAASGSVDNHLLVPDTRVMAPVPEPASLLLLGSGLVGAAVARRRRQR